MTEYVPPTPAVACHEPTHVIKYVSSAPVGETMAPTPAVTLSVPNQELHPAYTTTADTTDDNFDTTGMVNPQSSSNAVEASAPQIIVLLPLFEEFAPPVCSCARAGDRSGNSLTVCHTRCPTEITLCLTPFFV